MMGYCHMNESGLSNVDKGRIEPPGHQTKPPTSIYNKWKVSLPVSLRKIFDTPHPMLVGRKELN